MFDHILLTGRLDRYFASSDFPLAPRTSERNNTCMYIRTLFNRNNCALLKPASMKSLINHLSPSRGRSSSILFTSTSILNMSTFSHTDFSQLCVIQVLYFL